MPKPEVHEGDYHVPGPSTTTADGLPESGNGNSDPPRDSASEIPFPFDLQSSIDEESGNRKTERLLIIH